jgi:hypothetical protein
VKATKEQKPTAAEAWATELMFLIDELAGGTLNKLNDLLQDIPDGAELFPAYKAVLARLDLANAIDIVDSGTRNFESLLTSKASTAASVGAALVHGMLSRVNQLLDQGQNDPNDPIIRVRDFATLGVDAHERRVGYWAGAKPAVVAALAGITPVSVPGGAYVVLGSRHVIYTRKSVVKTLTDAMNEKIAYEQREQERIRTTENQAAQRLHAASPEGQRARIADLERQLTTLQSTP